MSQCAFGISRLRCNFVQQPARIFTLDAAAFIRLMGAARGASRNDCSFPRVTDWAAVDRHSLTPAYPVFSGSLFNLLSQQPQAVSNDEQARANVSDYGHPHRSESADCQREEYRFDAKG